MLPTKLSERLRKRGMDIDTVSLVPCFSSSRALPIGDAGADLGRGAGGGIPQSPVGGLFSEKNCAEVLSAESVKDERIFLRSSLTSVFKEDEDDNVPPVLSLALRVKDDTM